MAIKYGDTLTGDFQPVIPHLTPQILSGVVGENFNAIATLQKSSSARTFAPFIAYGTIEEMTAQYVNVNTNPNRPVEINSVIPLTPIGISVRCANITYYVRYIKVTMSGGYTTVGFFFGNWQVIKTVLIKWHVIDAIGTEAPGVVDLPDLSGSDASTGVTNNISFSGSINIGTNNSATLTGDASFSGDATGSDSISTSTTSTVTHTSVVSETPYTVYGTSITVETGPGGLGTEIPDHTIDLGEI